MFEEIIIRSEDGAEITALYLKAGLDSGSIQSLTNSSSDYLFLCLPAMGVAARYYAPLAKSLSEQGYDVLLCDFRGQGSSNQSVPEAKFGYHEIVTRDIPAFVEAAKKRCPDKKIITIGHSLGGQLGLLYAAQNPKELTAMAIIASGSVYYRAYGFGGAFKIWLGTQSSVLTSNLFGYFPGHKLGFGGKQPKRIMRDWARQARTGRYTIEGTNFDYEAAIASLALPFFALSINVDGFAPHSATEHLIHKAVQSEVTHIKHIPSADIVKKIDHFRWVKYNKAIIKELLTWVETLSEKPDDKNIDVK